MRQTLGPPPPASACCQGPVAPSARHALLLLMMVLMAGCTATCTCRQRMPLTSPFCTKLRYRCGSMRWQVKVLQNSFAARAGLLGEIVARQH